jgi:triosephosphate isomerase
LRTPLIAGNWKMYKKVDEAIDLVKALLDGLGTLPGREVVVCPPYTALYPVASCHYVIVGHSERRQYFGDNDAIVNRKLRAALVQGLHPILCVGESKPQRDAGKAEPVVVGQVQAGLAEVSLAQLAEVVIAYEPIWAIGTGDTATAADAQAMHATIRATLAALFTPALSDRVRIQYGGSVKPDNVDELMAQPDIDGALVGGASLKADSFLRIIHYR